jgi:hypothetical protein
MALARPLQIGRGLKPEDSDADEEKTDLNATDDSTAGSVGVEIDSITCACSQ